MTNPPLFNTRFVLLFVAALFCGTAHAESRDKTELSLDSLERELEMGRHQRLVTRKASSDSLLAEFTTDGCSGGLSVGWEYLATNIPRFKKLHGTRPAWESCCVSHDRTYHGGGSRRISVLESYAARKTADLALKACVLEIGAARAPELSSDYKLPIREVKRVYSAVAALMYRAVRIGGMPCTGLPWRWGYGWPECQ